jgi:hypothetical protein
VDACAHNSNTTGTTSGTVTGYSSGALECTMVLVGFLLLDPHMHPHVYLLVNDSVG